MMEENFRLDDGVLIIKSGIMKLPYPVVQALVFNELLIVRVEPDVGKIYNGNIFAYSNDGRLRRISRIHQ